VGPCSSTTPLLLTHSAASPAAAAAAAVSAATLKEPDLELPIVLKEVAGCRSDQDICRTCTRCHRG
jgi:hypothetical protein